MQVQLIKNIIWLFIAIVAAIVLQIPMLYHGDYAFILPNTLIIMVPILYIRNYLEFYELKFHKNKWFRYFIFSINIVLFMFILNRLELILGIIDSMDMAKLISSETISLSESVDLFKYINTEYLIASILSFIAIIIYNIKILSSFWRKAKIKRERKL